MFEPENHDKAAEAKFRAEAKAAAEILPFENLNRALGVDQMLNRPFLPLIEFPADMQTTHEGSWLNSKHNPKN